MFPIYFDSEVNGKSSSLTVETNINTKSLDKSSLSPLSYPLIINFPQSLYFFFLHFCVFFLAVLSNKIMTLLYTFN